MADEYNIINNNNPPGGNVTDQEIRDRFQTFMEDAARENALLKEEARRLKAENIRLKRIVKERKEENSTLAKEAKERERRFKETHKKGNLTAQGKLNKIVWNVYHQWKNTYRDWPNEYETKDGTVKEQPMWEKAVLDTLGNKSKKLEDVLQNMYYEMRDSKIASKLFNRVYAQSKNNASQGLPDPDPKQVLKDIKKELQVIQPDLKQLTDEAKKITDEAQVVDGGRRKRRKKKTRKKRRRRRKRTKKRR